MSESHGTQTRGAVASELTDNPVPRKFDDPQVLADLVAEGQERFGHDSTPEAILAWGAAAVGLGRLAIASSFADSVLAHLAARAVPGVDVLFVDTGYHFAETIGLRDAVEEVYDVNVRTLLPILSVDGQAERYGADLNSRDPDACCAMRKVAPFSAALGEYDGWASGLRRDDHNSRGDVQPVMADPRRQMLKINPLAYWTQDRVDEYVQQHSLLENPLRQIGYVSIGCAPCTRPVADGEDPRSGRWAGQAKVECGMHA
jgi:phosphoadenosine phosphosulfate reductase